MKMFFENSLILGNPKSNTAIISLWTKKERILEFADKKNFKILGNLYSKNGINYIIRNCLMDKSIRYLIITGTDLSGSGRAFLELSGNEDFIDKNISLDSISNFLSNVERINLIGKEKELKSTINKLEKKGSYGEPEYFPEFKPELVEFPSEKNAFIVREDFIGEAYLKIVSLIMKFGKIKESEQGEKQKELINVVSVIKKENPENPKMFDFFRFNLEELKKYFKIIMSPSKIEGVEYTYGERMFDYDGINQINSIIEKIKKNPNTRRAVVSTWNVNKDNLSSKSPCLDFIQFLVQDGLYMTAYFRSNDMLKAWALNAFALRMLQFYVAEKTGITPLELTIISSSAHIYESDFKNAEKLAEKEIQNKLETDPRGNFLIYVENNEIKLDLLSFDGRKIMSFSGKSAVQLKNKILDFVSMREHAFYLGGELERAEKVLKNNLEYRQE